MLLKVLVYGYIDKLYSSRKLEKATCENVNFMWLTGLRTPDHNTINCFYSFVWAKSVSGHKARLMAKINTLLDQIEAENDREDAEAETEVKDKGSGTRPPVEDSGRLSQTIADLNEQLKDSKK